MPPSNAFRRAMIRRRVRRWYNVLTERGHAARHYSRRQEPAGPLRISGEDVCRDIGRQGHARSARRFARPYPPGRRPGPAEATGDLRRPSAAGLRHRPALVSSRSVRRRRRHAVARPKGAFDSVRTPVVSLGLVTFTPGVECWPLSVSRAASGCWLSSASAQSGPAGAGAPSSAFVSPAPGGYRAEAILGCVTRQYRELALRDYGIDVVDVGLRRLDFPEQNRASVFARMKSERVRISMRFRSEGEEEGLKIRAASEKAKSGILGEAYKLSQKIRGEGEARAAKIYADSLARDPEFYRFVRSMDAMKKAVDKETTLVLPVDSELFRLLQDSRFRFPEH